MVRDSVTVPCCGFLLKSENKMAAPQPCSLQFIHPLWERTVSLSLKTNNDTQHSLSHTHTPPCHPTRRFQETHINTHTRIPQWEPGSVPSKICVLGRTHIHTITITDTLFWTVSHFCGYPDVFDKSTWQWEGCSHLLNSEHVGKEKKRRNERWHQGNRRVK